MPLLKHEWMCRGHTVSKEKEGYKLWESKQNHTKSPRGQWFYINALYTRRYIEDEV